MTAVHRTIALFAAGALLAAPAVRAEQSRGTPACVAARFSTCAAVQVGVSQHELVVSQPNTSWREWRDEGMVSRYRPSPDGEHFGIVIGDATGGPPAGCTEEAWHKGNCGIQTTVTPEPVSMTLLATGLVGLGMARRKRKVVSPL